MQNISKDYITNTLLNYCSYIDPNFMMPRHVYEIVSALDKFSHNVVGYDKLIISLPPRMGKSYLNSIRLPEYLLGLNPKEKILTTTYANELTKVFSKEIIKTMTSPEYQKIFPETILINSGRSANTWDTTAGGYLKCSSRDGTLTGLTGTTIIVDDMIKNSKEAKSPTLLKSLREWFDSTLYSRLTFQEDGTPPKIVILMTRWAKKDLIGHVIDTDDDGDWKYINLPAIDEKGKALWEEKQPLKMLLDIKKRDPEMFACVYMGRPGDVGSTEFEMEKYDIRPLSKELNTSTGWFFSSWDTASKISENHDFSVGTLWYVSSTKLYLVDYIRGKYTLPDLKKLIQEYHQKWGCKYTIIEDASSGTGLLQLLNREAGLKNKFKPITANVSKKLSAILPLLENHDVILKDFTEVMEELREYPLGGNDDCVASVVNAIYYWLVNHKTGGNDFKAINKLKRREQKRQRSYLY